MLSAILLINLKGDIIIQRYFRDDIPYTAAEAFRHKIASGNLPNHPIVNVDDVSFLYTRSNDVYVVAATRRNANAVLAYEFLSRVVSVFIAYFGTIFSEDAVRNNFVIIYELLDEMMDFGYPQLTSVGQLKSAISLGTAKTNGEPTDKKKLEKITSFITGGVDWREAGKHNYKKNEVFMDVLEAVNVLMSSDGTILRSDVSGKIVMKTYLSGMPECKFGFNDKLIVDKDAQNNNKNRRAGAVAIDDLSFHRCVSLAQFDQDRTVSFVPPDGEFTLAKYRVTNHIRIPFNISPNVIQRGRSRVEYQIVLKGNFDPSLSAVNVKMFIPVPPNTASINVDTTHGSAKLKPMQNVIQWKIPKFNGNGTYTLRGEAILAAGIEDKVWTKPPITLDFQVPMFTSSGICVRFLKVVERSQYEAVKWVRYMTRNGNYSVRI